MFVILSGGSFSDKRLIVYCILDNVESMNLKIKFLLLVILCFYIWTATAGSFNFNLDKYHGGFYNQLAESFRAGKLHFLTEPRQELLALKDPYDPRQNGAYRVHDASLYKGKYFIYFGVTPEILLFFPYLILTGNQLPEGFSVLLFSFGAFIFSILIIFYFRDKYFKTISDWVLMIPFSVLGLATTASTMLRRPTHYEIAISSGIFCLIVAIYYLLSFFKDLDNNTHKYYKLCIFSLFIGLSVGCRPHLGLSASLFPFILYMLLKKGLLKKDLNKILIMLFVPFFLYVSLLLTYNYLRFDNIIEFGGSYQTGVLKQTQFNYINLEYIPANFYIYSLKPPAVGSKFPFFFLYTSYSYPSNMPIKWPNNYYAPCSASSLLSVPYLLLSVIISFYLLLRGIFNKNKFGIEQFPLRDFGVIFLPFVLIVSFLHIWCYSCWNYLGDFLILFIILTTILWFYLDFNLINTKLKHYTRLFSAILAFTSILIVSGLSITGSYDLRYSNPQEFNKLEHFFMPVTKFLEKQFPKWTGHNVGPSCT